MPPREKARVKVAVVAATAVGKASAVARVMWLVALCTIPIASSVEAVDAERLMKTLATSVPFGGGAAAAVVGAHPRARARAHRAVAKAVVKAAVGARPHAHVLTPGAGSASRHLAATTTRRW